MCDKNAWKGVTYESLTPQYNIFLKKIILPLECLKDLNLD